MYSHDALILLRSCFCAPKIQHILRCTPCHKHPSLDTFDDLLRSGLCKIINADLSDTQWLQAGLPVQDGGLGIRNVARLAISAYLASAASTIQLQEEILSSTTAPQDLNAEQLSSIWSTSFAKPTPSPFASYKQSAWDSPRIQADKAELWFSSGDKLNVARLTAVSAPHSGDWLNAMPISACGLRLDNKMVRVAVGLRLGVDLCVPHDCPCGALVDARGIHSLS